MRVVVPGMVLLGACACGEPAPGIPDGECPVALWAEPRRAGVELYVRGSWDGWTRSQAMKPFDERWQLVDFSLPPGEYGYQIVEEGEGRLDENQGLTRFRESDGHEVSWLHVEACNAPRIAAVLRREATDAGVRMEFDVQPGRSGAPLDLDSVRVGGVPARAELTESGTVRVDVEGLPAGKHPLAIEVADTAHAKGSREVATWIRPRAERPADQIIYQVMVDRFRADSGQPLQEPAKRGGRAGGTLDGIVAELEAGTFEQLAVTTLWISPVYVNPDEERSGTDGQVYEGYHGYWPVDSRGVDPRIGGEQGLHALVAAAHARGIRVLLDLVPNHVYETNPRLSEYESVGGVHPSDPICVCGQPNCPWDQYIRTCWFVPYLPDLRFEAPGVLDLAVDDARWWMSTFNVDGFRIDAVPMMPRAVTRRISAAVRAEAGDPFAGFSLGEIFTGPGSAGTESLRYYLGPDSLDSAFDFPLMWALRDALAFGSAGFDAVERTLAFTEQAIADSNATLGLMVGNHDVTRFLSEAVGDAGVDPWGEQTAEQVSDAQPYARMAVALGLVMTLPGAPVLYYGDEVGLAGGRDPDSRRVMPAERELLPPQLELRRSVRRLAQARACLPALRRGERVPLVADADRFAFMRDAGDDGPALVLANRGELATRLELGPRADVGAYRDVQSGELIEIDASRVVELPPVSLRVLVPAAHACAG